MSRVHLIGTGGTIASRSSQDGAGGGAVAADSAADLLGSHSLRDVEVTSEDVLTLGSYLLGNAEMLTIARAALTAAQDPEVDGVVVTHGTDTMEETAFLTDLLHGYSSPIVFTGAQRAADHPNTDGPNNLAEAITIAADRRFRDRGALLSFDGQVQSARGVRKAHTTASQPFSGGVTVGLRRGEDWDVLARPHRPGTLPIPDERFGQVRADIHAAHPGSSPQLLHEAVRAGATGLVLAGTGVGNAGPGYAETVQELTSAGIPVVLASRTLAGPVVPTYGNGGGVDLVAAGAVVAGQLNPYQARILAAVLLADRPSLSEFTQRFSALR